MTEREKWDRAYKLACGQVVRAYDDEIRCRQAQKRIRAIRKKNGRMTRRIIKQFMRRAVLVSVCVVEKAYMKVHSFIDHLSTQSYSATDGGLMLTEAKGKRCR